jgi:hypothetical protein
LKTILLAKAFPAFAREALFSACGEMKFRWFEKYDRRDVLGDGTFQLDAGTK